MRTVGCRLAVGLLMIAGLALPGAPAAADTTGQDRVVARARLALDSFQDDPNFQDLRGYVQNAYGVLVIPDMLRAGFLIGGQHGVGVLVVRNLQTGAWGNPAFYELFGGSLGLQVGGVSSDVVLTIMTQQAVARLVATGFKFGADAAVAAGRTGAGIGTATTTHFAPEIFVFSKSRGLFGGFALDGSYLAAKPHWNAAYYDGTADPLAILASGPGDRAEVTALQDTLAAFAEPAPQFGAVPGRQTGAAAGPVRQLR